MVESCNQSWSLAAVSCFSPDMTWLPPPHPTPTRQSPAPCCYSIISHYTSQSSSWQPPTTYRSLGFNATSYAYLASQWTNRSLDCSLYNERDPHSLSVVVVQVETFACTTLGVKGVAPWTALDLVWTLDLCVTTEERGRERGREKGTGENLWGQTRRKGRGTDREKRAGWWETSTRLLKRTVKERR